MDARPPATRRVRDASRTRRKILLEGQRQFADRGYRATTVQRVADAAGVSPNLITRYFGGKDGLFLAATQTGLHLDRVLGGPRATLGRRLAESMVSRWDDVSADDPLLVLLRAAGDRPGAATALAEFLDHESLRPLAAQLRGYGLSEPEAIERAAAIEAFVIGVVTRRRILGGDLGDRETLTSWLAASIQRLAGDDQGTSPAIRGAHGDTAPAQHPEQHRPTIS